MHYGLDIANLGAGGDPRQVVALAQVAEDAGWEGLFLWDHLDFPSRVPSGDPWTILAAVAQATTMLRIGTAVTPLARRRPQVVAKALATLDLLSNGRVTFGAGLGGVLEDFSAFGETIDAKTRAAMLDEGLDLVARLLAGATVNHQGAYYTMENATLTPRPIQPHIPIWIGAESGPALRRAARWDGWIIYTVDMRGKTVRSAAQVGETYATIQQHRTDYGRQDQPYDLVAMGITAPGDSVAEFAAVGATWWLETLHGMRAEWADLLVRVKAGPPHCD